MEKAILLIERSGEHLRCLLNPERLELRRNAGIASRRSSGGPLTGAELSDDPLLFTGGGRTELILDLLFDVSLAMRAPDAPALADVRELTGALWALAENSSDNRRYGCPPNVRFIWGTGWNLPGVVVAVSERLEHFNSDGKPRRSWLRLQLSRVADAQGGEPEDLQSPPLDHDEAMSRLSGTEMITYEQVGGQRGERVDQIAAERFGHPGYWRLLALLNNLDNPLRLGGVRLQVPADLTLVGGGRR